MKAIVVWIATVSTVLLAAPPDTVIHPTPKKPTYVSESWYSQLKKQVQAPPAKGSALQSADELELRAYQKGRTPLECDQAKAEVAVSLHNFFGVPQVGIPSADIKKLSPFFEQLRNDADYFVQLLKKDFPRPRPFVYLTDINPCVPREVTGAYPSGHAVLSRLFALVLTDLYPRQKGPILVRAQEIADHRVVVGMHHRSDVETGQKLGSLIYEEFKKSPKYNADFKAAQSAVRAVN
jgi:acid phosphatase (class A)